MVVLVEGIEREPQGQASLETMVAELELNSVRPSPDKIEEEQRVYKDNGLIEDEAESR